MKLKAMVASIAVAAALFLAPAISKAGDVTADLIDVLHTQGVITDASYDELKKAQASGGEDEASRMLVDILHANGTLTEESYQKLITAEHAAPKSSPAVPVAVSPTAGDRPADSSFASVEDGFARLAGGDIKLKIGAWLQGGYVYDNSSTNAGALPGASTFVTNSGNSFHFRFARPYLNFAFKEKIGFRLMLDATSGTAPLRDAFIWFDYIPYTRVTFGQFLTQFGSETWRAPFDNPMINYSLASTLMQFNNFRDTGIMVAPKFKAEVAGMPLSAGVAAAVINGNGINASDDNDHKDVIGRAWIEPFVPGLQVGGSWYYGRSNNTRAGLPAFDTDWQRWGAEVNYAPSFAPGLALRGEYLFQRKYYGAPAGRMVHSNGWYAQASYRPNFFEGGLKFLNDVEPAVRYEYLDEDQAVVDNERTRLTLGVNYWFNKYLRLMANYEIIRADDGLDPVTGATIMPKGIDRVAHNVLTTHLQIWF